VPPGTLIIPLIALADGYVPLLLGRLLQGISGDLIGVVVPRGTWPRAFTRASADVVVLRCSG
jgi:hypothetical protein